MLPTVTHYDIGNPTEPGEYTFRGMTVRVDQQHLQAWRQQPETTFRTILCTRAGDTTIRLALGEPAAHQR
ncbi:hypothetical protein JNW90_32425 [Micromonospora sp. STR1s_5]|nr:hypothetical protein [Micromonospora sp. STR1s_5]